MGLVTLALVAAKKAEKKEKLNPYIFTEQLHVESANRLKKVTPLCSWNVNLISCYVCGNQAFFGGEPWLIYCYDEYFEKDAGFHQAADSLNSLGVRTAVLNCFDKLPSGKNTMDRFKLDRRFKPVMFLCANGGKPNQVV